MPAKPRASAPPERTGNPIRDSALGRVPETIAEIIALNGHVWRDSLVSPTLLEILRLRNARTVNCVFCKAVRYELAIQDGLTEGRAAMVNAHYRDSALAPREKRAVALADGYLGFPAGLSPELARELNGEFSPQELASMLLALMSFNFASRTAVSIGGMPEEPLPVMVLAVAATTQ
jgi:alkylhydroperoxidase family enzyme